MNPPPHIGRLPLALGYAGLLPQIAVVLMLLTGDQTARSIALRFGFAYAALILSFLGGIWWGLSGARPDRAPAWLWVAAVAPSLFALGSAWPWMVGWPWPQPSLLALGIALIAVLVVDKVLVAEGLASSDWLRLRVPLSVGLGALTVAAGML